MSDTPERTLPRDPFTVKLRELSDNPGAVKSSSRVDVTDAYGNMETWTIDTFRTDGATVSFVQRMTADGGTRLLMPGPVMAALLRQDAALTGQRRRLGARAAVATRVARGDTLGNPEALRKARSKPRRRKAKRGRKAVQG